jgi:hypothetical protein
VLTAGVWNEPQNTGADWRLRLLAAMLFTYTSADTLRRTRSVGYRCNIVVDEQAGARLM